MKTFILITIASMAATQLAHAQLSFGPQVQSTPSASITYDSGTGIFQYTDAANPTDDDAELPLTGSAASLITTSNDWSATLTASLSTRTISSGHDGMAFGVGFNDGTNHYQVGLQLTQDNNTGGTTNTDIPNNFYGTLIEFAAYTDGVNDGTTPLGTSGNYRGDSYQILSGGTSGVSQTETALAATGVLSLNFKASTDTLTGSYNGIAIGSYSLAGWGAHPALTLGVVGFSGEGLDVPAGTDLASNLSVAPEPSSWELLLIAFGLFGVLRRRISVVRLV